MTHTDLLRQSLEMLGPDGDLSGWTDAHYAALRAALAAPVEPVAQPAICSNCGGTGIDGDCGPDGRSIDVNCASCYGTGIGRGFSGIATPPAQPAPAVQVVLRQPNLFAADPAAPAVPDPWKSAVLDRLAATCMDAQQDEPPASILRRIIDWEVTVALDPAVSDIAPYLCIKPACGPDCSGCNCAISPQDMRDYAIRYAILRNAPINAIRGGGVFAGKTPDNVVINGEHLDAAVDALRGITGDSNG